MPSSGSRIMVDWGIPTLIAALPRTRKPTPWRNAHCSRADLVADDRR